MTAPEETADGRREPFFEPAAAGGPERIRVTARAVAVLYVYRAVTGFILGYPVARSFGALGASALADGDREFFAPGGLHLLEALRVGTRVVPSALESATLAGILVVIGGIFPFAVALTDILHPAGERRERFGRAAERAPTLLVLAGGTVLVQAVTLALTMMAVTAVASLTGSLRNERTGDLIPLFVGLIGLLLSFGLGVVQDLARAATVRHETRALASVRIAVRTFSAAPGAVLRAFVTPALVTAVLVIAGGAFASLLDVSRPGAWRVFGVALEHQLVILAIVVLRLGALARALALTGRHAPHPGFSEDDTPEDALTE